MTAPVEPGDMLAGKYRVERILGEGGMGVVVAATDTQLERSVAIKFLLKDYVGHPEASERFMREARAAVKIQSEHIARVIDVGTLESGQPYMVMEYLEGADLAGLIEHSGPVSVEEAVGHVLEACDAIAEAHAYGIIHRDIKPANLFLASQPDGSSKVKVLDFGISKATMGTSESGIDPSLTRTTAMMGSPLYMSPEQMRSSKNVDPRTDIWALGVILYELLAGEPPFMAESIPELSAKVLMEEHPPLSERRPDLPPGLEAVVHRCLAKDPADRYVTVADLAVALGEYATGRGRSNIERISRLLKVTSGAASSLGGAATMQADVGDAIGAETAAAWENVRGGGQKSNRMWIVAGGAVAAVVLAVGGFLALSSGADAEAPAAASGPAAAAAEEPAAEPEPKAATSAETDEPEAAEHVPGAAGAVEDAGATESPAASAEAPEQPAPARVMRIQRPRPPKGTTLRRVTPGKVKAAEKDEESEEPPSLRSRFGSRK